MKLLLHLGLPKTGTTTLQHHLFERLFQQEKIEYLGKLITEDRVTGEVAHHHSEGAFIREVAEGRREGSLSELKKIMHPDLLNVYSEEGITIFYPGSSTLTFVERIKRLRELLSDIDVTVLITIRRPVDFFYSLYVQLFPDYFQSDRRRNTFEKFARDFLEVPSKHEYEVFKIEHLLEVVAEYFPAKVLLYEEFKNEPFKYAGQLEQALDVDADVASMLWGKSENVKSFGVEGKRSVFRFRDYLPLIRQSLNPQGFLYEALRWIYSVNFLWVRTVLSREVSFVRRVHKPPSQELEALLCRELLFRCDFDAVKYGLSAADLKRYGYFVESDL